MRNKIWAIIALTVLVAGACAAPTTSAPATPGPKLVTILQSAEIKSMDPSNAFGSHEINVQSQVFDTLAAIDPQLNQLPWLATSWTMQTPTSWQVKLRTGVKFSNGDPFTADDVVASFNYLTRKDALAAPNFQGWSSVEKVDDNTVKVTTKAPDIRFFGELTSLYVMPSKLLSSGPASLADKPVGTGPFTLTEWVKGERIVMAPNHNAEVKPYAYDVAKAKDLLTQAGYPNGFTVEFHHPTGRWIKDVEVTQAIAGMLAKVGVQTTLSTGEYTSFFNTWATGAYKGMTMIGTLNQYDADQVYQLFLYSKGRWGAYVGKDDKLDGMYESQNTELDAKKREQTLHDMESYVHDQAYWLFLYFQDDVYASNKKLKWRAPSNEKIWMLDADLS